MGLLSRAAVRAAADSTTGSAVERELVQFHAAHGAFSGVLLETQAAGPGENALNGEVRRMLAAFGAAIPLNPAAAAAPRTDRSLALLPAGMDRELIAHRLTRSLRAKQALAFEAENPAQALSLLKPAGRVSAPGARSR